MSQLQNAEASTVQPQPVFIVEDQNHKFFVDPGSGEILNPSEQMRTKSKKRDLRRYGYVGVDTPWPATARNREELLEATAPFDWWADNKIVASTRLLHLLKTDTSSKALLVLHYLAENLVARNHWFGQLGDIVTALEMAKRSVERALKELEDKGLIRKRIQGKAWPMRISVQPWYAWRGDLSFRKAALNEWLGLGIGAP